MRIAGDGRCCARRWAGWDKIFWVVAVSAVIASQALAFEPLPRATPESLGIDPVRVDRFLEELDRVPGAESVVVVHRDRVIAEAYWNGSAATLRHLRSVTKSVSSTLIGIAVDRGIVGDLNRRMVDYLPGELIPSDQTKDEIRIRHLLTHTSGLRWEESGEFVSWTGSSNPLRFILDRPMESEPGTDFNYSTPATHVLSAVIEEAAGVGSDAFADAYLFEPLGITSWRWEDDPLGYPFGGHGLQLRTEDMAKLGVLFLNRGRWGDEQVVSRSWVDSAQSEHIGGNSEWGPVDRLGYGLLWWLADAGDIEFFMAWGWGGQFVVCAPTLDLVVATNANWQLDGTAASLQEKAILAVVVEELLPTIEARRPPPLRARGRVQPAATGQSQLSGAPALSGRTVAPRRERPVSEQSLRSWPTPASDQ